MIILVLKCLNQALEDCFNPYKDLKLAYLVRLQFPTKARWWT